MSTAAPLPLRECKIRASFLLKDLEATDPPRARRAAERLRVLPEFSRLSARELIARRESVRHKHALAVIAHEQGHASWAELKQARGEPLPPRVDFETFFALGSGAFLNRWFTTHADAAASLEAQGGYLFPYRHQFFLCEAGFLQVRGVDAMDPDWERIGRDWVAPRDPVARDRLEQKLIALGFTR